MTFICACPKNSAVRVGMYPLSWRHVHMPILFPWVETGSHWKHHLPQFSWYSQLVDLICMGWNKNNATFHQPTEPYTLEAKIDRLKPHGPFFPRHSMHRTQSANASGPFIINSSHDGRAAGNAWQKKLRWTLHRFFSASDCPLRSLVPPPHSLRSLALTSLHLLSIL